MYRVNNEEVQIRVNENNLKEKERLVGQFMKGKRILTTILKR